MGWTKRLRIIGVSPGDVSPVAGPSRTVREGHRPGLCAPRRPPKDGGSGCAWPGAGRIPFWQVATGGAAGHRPTASRPVEARAAAAAARRAQGPSLSVAARSLRASGRRAPDRRGRGGLRGVWPVGCRPVVVLCRSPLLSTRRLDQASQPGRPAGRVRPGPGTRAVPD
jgi:hypothetical protein